MCFGCLLVGLLFVRFIFFPQLGDVSMPVFAVRCFRKAEFHAGIVCRRGGTDLSHIAASCLVIREKGKCIMISGCAVFKQIHGLCSGNLGVEEVCPRS